MLELALSLRIINGEPDFNSMRSLEFLLDEKIRPYFGNAESKRDSNTARQAICRINFTVDLGSRKSYGTVTIVYGGSDYLLRTPQGVYPVASLAGVTAIFIYQLLNIDNH